MKSDITHTVDGKGVSASEFDKAFGVDSIVESCKESLVATMESIEKLYCVKHSAHPKLVEKDGKACVESCCEELEKKVDEIWGSDS